MGETKDEREKGLTESIIEGQLSAIASHVSNWATVVIAYEPVWAIGTGLTATPEMAQAVHAFIRSWLSARAPAHADSVRIVYGGNRLLTLILNI